MTPEPQVTLSTGQTRAPDRAPSGVAGRFPLSETFSPDPGGLLPAGLRHGLTVEAGLI
jgi:hypothetical protein